MKRSTALRIGAELIPVLLVLACLGGSLALVIAAHRRQADAVHERATAVVMVSTKPVPPKPRPVPGPAPPPVPEPVPEPPEDPTAPIVAAYGTQADEQRSEAARADARTAGAGGRPAPGQGGDRTLAAARAARPRPGRTPRCPGRSPRNRGRRPGPLPRRAGPAPRPGKGRVGRGPGPAPGRLRRRSLPRRARHLATSDRAGVPRRHGQDSARRTELQHPGAGRRLHCAVEKPDCGGRPPRVRRARLDVAPDGGTIVPYILFVIRPDGIRPYYEARGRLEHLGIAFGYELVGQDAVLDFPDLDDPAEWPGAPPRPITPLAPNRQPALADGRPGITGRRLGTTDRPETNGRPGRTGRPGVGGDGPYVWHAPEPPARRLPAVPVAASPSATSNATCPAASSTTRPRIAAAS